MNIRVASFTPIRVGWPHALMEITQGIRVIEKPTFNETNWKFWNLRRTDEEHVLGRTHWLCVEKECDWLDRAEVVNGLASDLRTAMLGFQLWAPKGWDGVIVDTVNANDGALNVERVHLAEAYPMSQWGKMLEIGKLDPARLAQFVEGTLTALASGSVPVINPFQFFEIGLQTAFNHRRAGAVLWMMGLDALLFAEKQVRFSRRLKKLLGKDTPVFPEDWAGRRPKYTVGEVAAGMFDLRNLIAHGKEILEKYRQPIMFEFEPPELAYLNVEKWTYGTLLLESSLFTFIAALRKVIADGHIETMKDKKAWVKWLDAP
jgi:hypothetical protein